LRQQCLSYLRFFISLLFHSFYRSDAARRRAEDILNATDNAQTAAGEELLEQERQKRAEVEAHNQTLLEKIKLMEEQFARQQEIITASKDNNQSALAAPLATAATSAAPLAAAVSPAHTMSPANLTPEDNSHALVENSPFVERSMEDLIHDLGGGVSNTDEDDDEVAGGGGRLLLIQKKEGIIPLKDHNAGNDVGRPTKVVSPCQNNTCSSVGKKKAALSLPSGEVRSTSLAPKPASRLHSDPSADEEENTPPAQVEDGEDAHEAGGLFTLFRGLPSGGGKEGEASGETMMDDNESKSIISSEGEGKEGEDMEIEGNDGSNDAAFDGVIVKEKLAIAPKRDRDSLDGPEPFQSQISNNE